MKAEEREKEARRRRDDAKRAREKNHLLGLEETIDTAGKDSFPASDPPCWSATHVGTPIPVRRQPEMFHDIVQRIRDDVRLLSTVIGERNDRSPRGIENLARAADAITDRLRDAGVPVRRRPVGEGICNVEAVLRGARLASETVVVGAHYDTPRGSPGADDNASGVAALLEIGRLLCGARPAQTIRLVAFVNEEPPFFPFGQMGSRIYARAARERRDDIRVMFSLEMLGTYCDEPGSQRYPPLLRWLYPRQGNFVAFVSNLKSRGALRDAVRAFRTHSDFPCESLATLSLVPGVAWSDQLSFWREGYRAVMVTDTAFYRNPRYHTELDTPDRLAYPEMARVVDGLALAVLDLAGGSPPISAASPAATPSPNR